MIKCTPDNLSAEWEQNWSGKFPFDRSGIRKSWMERGFDNDGGKYMENGWQDSWHFGHNGENSAWNKKQILENDWDVSGGKHNWFWGNGGSRVLGTWGNGKYDLSKHYGSIDHKPENSYISWGSINTNNWKNNGGGEDWSKWEVNNHEPGNGGHEYGEWKGWKVGLGSGKWDSWNSGSKP